MSETISLPQQPSTTQLALAGGDRAGKQPANDSDQLCWIQMKEYPYHPDHQVELLHLQAEADALMIKLQTVNRKDIQGKT